MTKRYLPFPAEIPAPAAGGSGIAGITGVEPIEVTSGPNPVVSFTGHSAIATGYEENFSAPPIGALSSVFNGPQAFQTIPDAGATVLISFVLNNLLATDATTITMQPQIDGANVSGDPITLDLTANKYGASMVKIYITGLPPGPGGTWDLLASSSVGTATGTGSVSYVLLSGVGY